MDFVEQGEGAGVAALDVADGVGGHQKSLIWRIFIGNGSMATVASALHNY
jgi:hypothetical protein